MTASSNQPASPIAPVVRAAWVLRPPEEAFQIFTDEIGAWWPLPSHGLFSARSGGVAFLNGQLVERAIDGTEAVWGEIKTWEPPSRLVMSWHPGRAEPDASEVEVLFVPDGDGTRVIVEHRGWETFGTEATSRRRDYVGPGAWGYVLDHYADGVEVRGDAPDLSALETAYEAFFGEAGQGDFGPPPPGHWTADEVIAHVALNDAAMISVGQGLVHGTDLRFENLVCHDPSALTRWIKSCANRYELIERGRRVAQESVGAIRRLSPEHLATEVDCRLVHEGDVVLDAPRPWEAIAITAQAGMHLPAHTEQLTNLRSKA